MIITDNEIEKINALIGREYFITENGVFDGCLTVDELLQSLARVLNECLDVRMCKDSYLYEAVESALYASTWIGIKTTVESLNIDTTDGLAFDTVTDKLYARNTNKKG